MSAQLSPNSVILRSQGYAIRLKTSGTEDEGWIHRWTVSPAWPLRNARMFCECPVPAAGEGRAFLFGLRRFRIIRADRVGIGRDYGQPNEIPLSTWGRKWGGAKVRRGRKKRGGKSAEGFFAAWRRVPRNGTQEKPAATPSQNDAALGVGRGGGTNEIPLSAWEPEVGARWRFGGVDPRR
jgi:hypothetical protein